MELGISVSLETGLWAGWSENWCYISGRRLVFIIAPGNPDWFAVTELPFYWAPMFFLWGVKLSTCLCLAMS